MRKYGNDGQFTIVIPSTRHVSSRATLRQRQDGTATSENFRSMALLWRPQPSDVIK
jgi:hypothetical protein